MKIIGPNDVTHLQTCKSPTIEVLDLGDGFAIYTCADCGATVDTLPADGDLFWVTNA